MSTLGKILTVLVVLVSVAVGVLVAQEIVVGEKWRQRYDDQVKLFTRALEQRQTALGDRDKIKTEWTADAAQKQQQVEVLKNDLATAKGLVTTMSTDKENQEKRLAEAVEQLKGLEKSLAALVEKEKAYRQERDDSKKRGDDLQAMYNQLEARFRVAQADLASAKESLRQTTEQKAALESRITYITTTWPEVKLPAQVPAVPTEKVQGLVVRVDAEAKVAEINLGSDDGVVKGMKFFVYNGGEQKYLATLVITNVNKDSAAGELQVVRGTVKVSDHVTNRFE